MISKICKRYDVKNCLSLLILIAVSGCGFHLRGAIVIPSELKAIKITPDNPNEKLQRMLITNLKKNLVTIVDVPRADVTTLNLSEASFTEEVLAIGTNNQPQRLKLSMSFSYSLYASTGAIIQGPITITSAKEFNINPNNLLSFESESNIIKDELYQLGIAKLLRSITKAYK